MHDWVSLGDRVAHRPLPGKAEKALGIVNDPNDWGREIADPRYIIDLFARIVTVSLHTMRIVDSLPALANLEDQKGTST